jgi:hypothetical protein
VAGLANDGSCRSVRVGAVTQQAQLGHGSRSSEDIRRREDNSGPQGRGFDSLQAHQILNTNGGLWQVRLNMLMVGDHNGITICWVRST